MAGITRVALLNSVHYLKRAVSHTLSVSMSYFTGAAGHVLPDGVYPTMITPMNDDKSVDWAGVDSKCSLVTLSSYCYL